METKELLEVKGGGIHYGIAAVIVAAGAFLIGLLDGIFRPYGCRS